MPRPYRHHPRYSGPNGARRYDHDQMIYELYGDDYDIDNDTTVCPYCEERWPERDEIYCSCGAVFRNDKWEEYE